MDEPNDIAAFYRNKERGKVFVPPIRARSQPGRNERCSCGSGLKYKRCTHEGSVQIPGFKDLLEKAK